MDLNDRSRTILHAIIDSYIATAEPVGSRSVTKRYELGISPATVRNIMSDLEELGFLSQPHTSAGRVPTDKAYRFYIDSLLEVRLPKAQEDEIMNFPLPRGDFHQLMQEVSRLLSGVSHYAGIVMAPKPADTIYRHIEFIRLTGRRALAIFVSDAGIIHNRVLELEEDITQKEFEQLAGFLNREFSGRTLTGMRRQLLAMMDADRNKYTKLLSKFMHLWEELGGESQESELFVGGLSGILSVPDFQDIEKMKELFAAFEEKRRLLNLLDEAVQAEGVQVFIGSENKYFEMQGVSMVVASYRGDGNVVGTLGVIGPSRMPYNRVIPLVDLTARVLGNLISDR